MPTPDLAAALNDLGARIKRQQVSPTTRDPYLVASFERVQAAVVAKCDELGIATARINELTLELEKLNASKNVANCR